MDTDYWRKKSTKCVKFLQGVDDSRKFSLPLATLFSTFGKPWDKGGRKLALYITLQSVKSVEI